MYKKSEVPNKIVTEINVLKLFSESMKGSQLENTLSQESVDSAVKVIENLSLGIVSAINTGNEIVEQMGSKCPSSLKNYITGLNGSLVGVLNGTCDIIGIEKYLNDDSMK